MQIEGRENNPRLNRFCDELQREWLTNQNVDTGLRMVKHGASLDDALVEIIKRLCVQVEELRKENISLALTGRKNQPVAN